MKNRKQDIIDSGLRLFAERGFRAISTKEIAEAAGVSEALIFRHFRNKDGLLQAIIEQKGEKIQESIEGLKELASKALLKELISLPFSIIKSDPHYWTLIHKIKWELDITDKALNEQFLKMLKSSLKSMSYPNSSDEAQLLFLQIEGIAAGLIHNSIKDPDHLLQFLLRKYHL